MLSDEFLGLYRILGDNFPNLLARSTYLGKYCRNGETWTDTVRRVVEGNCALDPNVTTEEAEALFHAIWNGWALPPGRGLWTGGVEGIPVEARYNCAKGNTLFWANKELRRLDDLEGQTVDVLCMDGEWRPAEVKSFGVQRLFEVSFKPAGKSNFRLTYHVTANHRWFTNRGWVTDLKVGDKVRVTPLADVLETQSEVGFIHGLIYGDGCATTGRPKHYQIRLCGDKATFLERLVDSDMYVSHSYPASYNGDPHVRLKTTRQLKCLPDCSETLEYQASFLQGFLAADGFEVKAATGICISDDEAIQWIEERAPLLGYCITGRATGGSRETNYGSRRCGLTRLMLVKSPVEYVVESVEDTGVSEKVYCVVEPVTTSFTLAGGMPTGNCYYTTLRSIDDWCWLADMLMCGGGVGLGLGQIDCLDNVEGGSARLSLLCSKSHPNVSEVLPDDPTSCCPLLVPDSRQGWVWALRNTLESAWAGKSLTLNLSSIRSRGEPIKTFGGIACGPGPLATLLREVWALVRKAAGRKLTSVECLDITNHIGVCIKSGNVRRSALIVLGNADDQAFRDAKKSWDAVRSHRHSSNNSIVFETEQQIDEFDWRALVEDNAQFGEPGIFNLWKARQTDPLAEGINPCGEQILHNREACNLAEVFPALLPAADTDNTFRLITRYAIRQRLEPILDPTAETTRVDNMRIGVGLGGICDFAPSPAQLEAWRVIVQTTAREYAAELGVATPIATTTVKPSGTISLLNGASPGIHAPFAPFYIRRTRISKQEPMAQALMDAGVPNEPCVYDSTGNTLVFSFPMRAKPGTKDFVTTETVKTQIERQVMVQKYWADNAVSTTITFREDEKEELAALLKTYAKDLKSISCLPKAHGYAQPPYEEIDEATYINMSARIDLSHKLTVGGDLDTLECEGGACPIK